MKVEGQSGFCRDCLTDLPAAGGPSPHGAPSRCTNCGSPRLMVHDELATLSIAHLDCDAFYASIEKRDNPDLVAKPVIIGGGTRGVVSTACYVARTYGVRSAMPMFKAKQACPDAVIIKPNIDKYAKVGRQVRQMMQDLTPMVQPLSIDEAFMDLTGTDRLHGMVPAKSLAVLSKRIEDEVGISVSVGLAPNKFLAKMSSDERKPRGMFVLGSTEVMGYLAAKPVSAIWGVGKAMQSKLQQHGLQSIAQLQQMDQDILVQRYGDLGLRLYNLSRGIDHRKIIPQEGMKSISSETTFNDDLADFDDLDRVLWNQAERVARRAKAKDYAGYTVTLKLRTNQFRSITRSRTLFDPTQLADVIYRTAQDLLRPECNGIRYRLLGVGISNLTNGALADPGDLVDTDGAKRAKVERAVDVVREKFGKAVIDKGRAIKPE